MAKITKATIKSFIKKADAEGNLYSKVLSSFDGMTDCVQQVHESEFQKVVRDQERLDHENTLGIRGLWMTHDGNLFEHFNDGTYDGYEIYNCCGTSIIARKMESDSLLAASQRGDKKTVDEWMDRAAAGEVVRIM
jgi:hypothetical protein